MKQPERVDETTGQEFIEFAALLIGEACVTDVLLGSREIDRFVRDVHVTADDDALARCEIGQILPKAVLEGATVVDARKLVLGIRRIDAHEVEALELERHRAALAVEAAIADPVENGERLALREDGRARIALLLRVAPVLVIIPEVEWALPLLELCLLDGEDVRVEFAEDVIKTLLDDGAQPVDVP